MTRRTGQTFITVFALALAVGVGATVASAASSATTASPLEGTWVAPAATCEQQNATLDRAGFSAADLELAGWDEATCGEMMHGSQMTLRFSGDRLVLIQDDVVGWDGSYRIVDESTFEAGDSGTPYISYGYAIDGDELTIDMVRNDYPALTPEEMAGELVAQTVILETMPFTLDDTGGLPYALGLPGGWTAATEADTYQSADGTITLTVGTGNPEPGQTVEDRVRINRESEFAECASDPARDRPVTLGGEPGIMWSFACTDEAGLAANTIHDGLGYRLMLRAPAGQAAELESLMAEFVAGFTFPD